MTDKLISKELYDAAVTAWAAARARVADVQREHELADKAMQEAEEGLAAQEAFPGIAAYAHAAIAPELCRIGYQCRIHGPMYDDVQPF